MSSGSMQEGDDSSKAYIFRRKHAKVKRDSLSWTFMAQSGDYVDGSKHHWIFTEYCVGFFKHFRTLVSGNLHEEGMVIGGEGVIVEVDETKLGKRKYNRGHRVDGVWVLVGVERTPARRVFLAAVENRTADNLQEIIRNHVLPGSIVHTDMWRGYTSLEENTGLTHRMVNHSAGFIDQTTGVHTNFVEGTNFALKRSIPIRCRVRENIEEHLFEFVWRRQNESSLWESFLEAMRDTHYDLQ